MRGTNTKFTKEIKIGLICIGYCNLLGETINVPKIEECPRVVEIISDTELKINTKFEKPVEKPTSYKVSIPVLFLISRFDPIWITLSCITLFGMLLAQIIGNLFC